MYIPASFRLDDPVAVAAFVERHDFATLVSHAPEGLLVSHLPVLARSTAAGPVLVGHLARANPHWRAMDGARDAVAIFHGPHGYISPTWYATGPAVPTWNYAVVHAHGRPQARDDADFVRGVVADLTERYERDRRPRWDSSSLPPDFHEGLLRAIVGFEMPVMRFEAKLKLSQNRSPEDRQRVIDALEREGAPALAALMRRHGGS
jgi:transcriptional regulator